MKGMILAAGRGTRMCEPSCPKPLMKVAGHALIEYRIVEYVKAGITDIVINVHHHGQMIQEYLGSGSQYGANIIYSVEEELLNTGGGLCRALPILGDDPFVVVNADVWSDFPIKQLATREPTMAHLVLVSNPEHNPTGDFSIEHGFVRKKYENPYTFSGISYYHPEFFTHCPKEPFGLGDWLLDQAQHALVTAEVYNGEWVDVGTKGRLKQVEDHVMKQGSRWPQKQS